MTALDYFVLIVVIVSVVSGASKGILKGIISLASALAGLIAAVYLYEYAAKLIIGFVETRRAAELLGFVAIFLLVIIAGSLIARWLRGSLKRARLDWVDHALGAGFGLLRGWLICSVIYLALTAFPAKLDAVERATFAPALLEGTRALTYLTSRELRDRFYERYLALQQLWGREV